MSTIVWAFQEIAELQGAIGFVECDDALALKLIAEGRAQDPQVGGSALKPIEGSAPRARRAAATTPVAPSPHGDAPPPAMLPGSARHIESFGSRTAAGESGERQPAEPQSEPTHVPLPPGELYDDDPTPAPPIDEPEPEQRSERAEYETKVVTPKRRTIVKPKRRTRR